MPWSYSPETLERARELYETTTRPQFAIARELGVSQGSISLWAAKHGWTRPEGRRTWRPIPGEVRAAAWRMRELGARTGEIAALAGRVPREVRRLRAEAEPEASRAAVPPHLAELHQALMRPELRKEDAAPLLTRAAAALGAEALVRQDSQVDRTAQLLARLATRIAALPDQGRWAGKGLYDDPGLPATYDETNALLEELARRYEEFTAEHAEEAGGESVAGERT